jgi:hypothetical protein
MTWWKQNKVLSKERDTSLHCSYRPIVMYCSYRPIVMPFPPPKQSPMINKDQYMRFEYDSNYDNGIGQSEYNLTIVRTRSRFVYNENDYSFSLSLLSLSYLISLSHLIFASLSCLPSCLSHSLLVMRGRLRKSRGHRVNVPRVLWWRLTYLDALALWKQKIVIRVFRLSLSSDTGVNI